ncbi:hypothetical protein BKA66DRAFT_436536 [Pyrenochaeta sp. MPI-SDFR-AT-0127]|nr:hypothetical protein BKA66DRAFT_436536 [Pyrenochaeta sp. MPI-SDFR-AT-0127]
MPFHRSRGGCKSCKKRKRKCDETRPSCRACLSKGTSCGGYDIQLRWNPRNAPTSPSSDHGNQLEETHHDSEQTLSDSGMTIQLSPVDVEADEVDQAFERFLMSGIHTLYSTTIHEWIKAAMAEASQRSPALLAACANVQFLLESRMSLKFHQHFERALQMFQVELYASNRVINGPTLAAGLLHSQGIRWTDHLWCMTDLYNLHGDLANLESETDMFTRHCLEVIGVMDMPNLVLGRNTPSLGFWKRLRRIQNKWTCFDFHGVEPVSGLPRTLLDISSRIEDTAVETQLWLWGGEIGEFLQCHFWDAWRYAALLDHRHRWRKTPRPANGSLQSVVLPTSTQLMFRLLSSLEALRLGIVQQENSHLLIAGATLYPWFVASTAIDMLNNHPEWKAAVNRYRDEILASDPSENVRILIEVVTEAQRQGNPSFDADAAMKERRVEIALF